MKSDPVSARNKFFQPVLGDETSDSSNSMVSKETKDGRAVFESLKLEDGKFFPDSRLNVRGSRESDMPTAVGSHPKYLSNLKNSSLISTSTTEVEPESNDNGKSAGENSVDVEGLSRTMENMNPPNTAEYSKSACLMEPDRDRVEDKSSSQTEPQRVDSERASPVGGASNSVQWVEKTPGVSRYETNRARIVDPSRSPESPDFDFTKSLFWVEKTPASHTSKVARKDLSSVAKSARQVVGQAEKPRITCTENKTDADSHFNITDESDSTILPTRDLREPCVKSSTIESDEKEVNQCQENNRLSSSHIKPSPATPSELQYEVRERNHSYIDHQPESSSGAEWSEKSQHKISSGRLGKDANARREECGLAHDDILIVRVFSPNATSPHASTTSPSMDNLTISQKLHRKRESFSHDHKAASPNTVPSYKHVSPTARCNSPANRRKVRFSDVVTRIGSDEAAVGSSMPSPSVNARSQSPCDGYLETKQLRDGCETTPEKPAMKNLKDYNPTDLDLSFLDSLHVIAIETKNDSMAKVSTLARPQHSTTHLQEEAPSTASVTRASQTLPPFTTQSVPNVTTGSYRTQMTTPAIQDNLRPVPSTLPVSVSCESSVYSASSDVKVNISLCKSEDIVTMKEKASVTHELSAKSVSFASAMPETPSCPATNLGTKADGNNMQDATGISQGSRTHGHRNNTMPTNFLIETGGVYSFASQENDANADESPTPLYSRILSREDASSPLQMCHTPLISSPFTRGKADHVPFWKAGDSATPKKEVTTPVIQSNLAPIPSTLPVSVHDTEKDDIITNGKSVNHSLIGSNSSHSVVSITYPDLPDSKYDTSQSCRVGVEESNYPKTHPSACGNNAIKYAIPHALKPTPLKPQSLFADVKDSTVNTTSICKQLFVCILAQLSILLLQVSSQLFLSLLQNLYFLPRQKRRPLLGSCEESCKKGI